MALLATVLLFCGTIPIRLEVASRRLLDAPAADSCSTTSARLRHRTGQRPSRR
ncbi:MAG: hypothetical protein HQ464_06320 [Planctomycetes bacterium]|nr:hypothetical protein [Planctomycetota bacterium]